MSKEADQVLELYNKQVLSVKLINKIKDHITNEMKEYKQYMKSDYQDSFQDALFEGRNEYAESLLKQIKEWEKS
jgi:hypothetical protein